MKVEVDVLGPPSLIVLMVSVDVKQYMMKKSNDLGFICDCVSNVDVLKETPDGKRKDLGTIQLRLSYLFKKVVVCGHCLVTLSVTSY